MGTTLTGQYNEFLTSEQWLNLNYRCAEAVLHHNTETYPGALAFTMAITAASEPGGSPSSWALEILESAIRLHDGVSEVEADDMPLPPALLGIQETYNAAPSEVLAVLDQASGAAVTFLGEIGVRNV